MVNLNCHFTLISSTWLIIILSVWSESKAQTLSQPDSSSTREVISADQLENDNRVIYISDRWKFQPGDNPEWASPAYDDSDWSRVSTYLTELDLAFIEWDGIGWFRMHVTIDSLLAGKPLALLVEKHSGASEVFIDGRKILEFGEFSEIPDNVVPNSNKNPRVITFPEGDKHEIAVRYTDPNYAENIDKLGSSGFRFLLGDWEYHSASTLTFIRNWTQRFMFFLGIMVGFGVIHILLYLYYPKENRNLYFSLFAFFLALLVYSHYKIELSGTVDQTIFLTRVIFSTEVITLVFATIFTHSIYKQNLSVYILYFFAAGLIISLVVWLYPLNTLWLREIFVILAVFEILRVLMLLFKRKKTGAYILGTGVLFFVCGLLYTVAVNLEWMEGNASSGSMAGASFLIMSMSVYLSREFSLTQKRLEHKIIETRELSRRSLKQEKISKQREIEKRLLEAENERKTKELEEARALQLSMLPKKLPSVSPYDIAVYMETANEVGGDYYDYSISNDGSLTLTVGDATGHGLKAGIMVAAAKSYFHTLVNEGDPLTMLSRMSSGIRNLDIKMMYMSLLLVTCKNGNADITAAGMPPVLHFQKRKQNVDEIILKGLPLGTKVDYPYQTRRVELLPGDCLMLMSDGLMELFNDKREMLGMDKIKRELEDAATDQAGDIINRFVQLIDKWSGKKKNEDDVTIMVIKVQDQ
jgi:serine phosphatase RsbU (regulator of sigma subunit)